MCRQVQDLRSVLRGKIEKLEQDLKSKEDELAQLEARKEMLDASGFASEVSVRVPGMSMGASAEQSAPKKKKKQKRHPGLPSQAGQEYFKSYLVHLWYWHCLVLLTVISLCLVFKLVLECILFNILYEG